MVVAGRVLVQPVVATARRASHPSAEMVISVGGACTLRGSHTATPRGHTPGRPPSSIQLRGPARKQPIPGCHRQRTVHMTTNIARRRLYRHCHLVR